MWEEFLKDAGYLGFLGLNSCVKLVKIGYDGFLQVAGKVDRFFLISDPRTILRNEWVQE